VGHYDRGHVPVISDQPSSAAGLGYAGFGDALHRAMWTYRIEGVVGAYRDREASHRLLLGSLCRSIFRLDRAVLAAVMFPRTQWPAMAGVHDAVNESDLAFTVCSVQNVECIAKTRNIHQTPRKINCCAICLHTAGTPRRWINLAVGYYIYFHQIRTAWNSHSNNCRGPDRCRSGRARAHPKFEMQQCSAHRVAVTPADHTVIRATRAFAPSPQITTVGKLSPIRALPQKTL